MYCILITGIPASGKSTMADYLAEKLNLPVISKDRIKELMYDVIGFQSRAEKVKLGVAGMNIMYYVAEQLMRCRQPFILENNFENISRDGLLAIFEKYSYTAITVTLTGDYEKIYRRFLDRNNSPERHRGHVVNDCYPEAERHNSVPPISYENFVAGIVNRGMDRFAANGPHIILDTTDFGRIDYGGLLEQIIGEREEIMKSKLERQLNSGGHTKMFREMRRKRQQLSTERTEEILRTGITGILGVSGDDGYPYTVPVNYVYEAGAVYFHCAKSGHKLDSIRKNDKVSFCVVDQETIVPEEFTAYFRSAVVFGRAAEVEDEAEKRRILRLLNGKYAPGLEKAGDQEIQKEWKAVSVVKIWIEHMTGKEAIELVKGSGRGD